MSKNSLIFVLLVFATVVGSGAWKGLASLQMESRNASVASLQTVMNTTRGTIHLWADNNREKARIIAMAPPLVDLVKILLTAPRVKASLLDTKEMASARTFIAARHGASNPGYFVIDPEFVNLVSVREDDLAAENVISKRRRNLLERVFGEGRTVLVPPIPSDVEIETKERRLESGYPVMFIVTPIMDSEGNIIAALALALDPAGEFSSIAQAGRIGETGETYAVDMDGHMLTDSRFADHLRAAGLIQEGQTGSLNVDVRDPGVSLPDGMRPELARKDQPLTLMADKTIKKEEGCFPEGYRDYRGVRVLGCGAWDETLQMGVITEIDEAEALGQFNQAKALFLLVLGISAILTMVLAFGIFSAQARSTENLTVAREVSDKAARDLAKANDDLARANDEIREAMTDVRRQEQLLQTIIDNTTALIYLKDRDGKYILVNRRYARLMKRSKEEAKGKNDHDLFPWDVADQLAKNDQRAMLSSEPTEVEESVFGDKKRVYLSMKFPLRRVTGEPYAICNISTDITERKRTEEKLQLAASVFENSAEGVIVTDAAGVIQSVNPAFAQITGYEPAEAIGKNPSILKSGKHDADFYRQMWIALLAEGRWKGELWNRKKSGEAYLQQTTITAIRDFTGAVAQYAAVFYDITEMRRSEQEVKFKAYHDALTGLPNRQLFVDRLKQAIMRAKRNGSVFSVLFIDLDGFKLINDSLGHSVGDLLLRGVAIRLVGCAREEDTVARLGGDEFTIIIENMHDTQEAATVARRVIEAMAEPFSHKNEELFITSSVGIALYPENGETPDDLLKNADLAMYSVKTYGKNNFMFFTQSLNEKAVRRHDLESKLRKAQEKGEIFAVFQPKVEMATGRIAGMEALMRWRQASGEFISPMEFIPVAEETGMIRELDEFMLDTSCAFMRKLLDDGLAAGPGKDLSISVNFSAKDLEQPSFADKLIAAVKKHRISPRHIEVELTENALVKNIENTVDKLYDLREFGFNISIDDFGTGYSSLSYLVKFPINYLKLDRSFVVDLFKDPDAKTVAKAVVSMAHEINVEVVAEGVETQEQLAFLRGIGCDLVQGYIFAKPSPREQIVELLEKKLIFPVTA
ncbi:MAG: EAL domain-containing protein [Nitrospinota bacterium]|nr:EAL domain-containing protein [Nitrospinota bacterium]